MKRVNTNKGAKTITYLLLTILFYFVYMRYVNGTQMGDISSHINTALMLKGYTLNIYIFWLLAKLSPNTYFLIALFLSLCTVLGIYFSEKLMLVFVKSEKQEQSKNSIMIFFLAILTVFIGSIYIPYLYPYVYTNSISPNAYHNSTLIEMRLFAIISLIYFFKLHKNYLKKIEKKDAFLFTLFLLLTNAIKPNFILGFAPAVLICMVCDLIRNKKNINWKILKNMFEFGCCILVSLLPLIYQYFEVYGNPSNGKIVFSFGGRFTQTGNPIWKIICGLLFVILIYLYNMFKKNLPFWFRFINLMTLVNMLVYTMLLEENSTAGNFGWGLKCSLYILYLADFSMLLIDWKQSKTKKEKMFLIFLILYIALQILSGVMYLVNILVA